MESISTHRLLSLGLLQNLHRVRRHFNERKRWRRKMNLNSREILHKKVILLGQIVQAMESRNCDNHSGKRRGRKLKRRKIYFDSSRKSKKRGFGDIDGKERD